MKAIYLDHNATTPIREEVLATMLEIYRSVPGNPSSPHHLAREARHRLELARAEIAAAIEAHPEEIVFTGGGTEADNLAVQGMASARQPQGNHLITSAVEHPAVLATARFLEKAGFPLTVLPVDRTGRVDPEQLSRAIQPETILISIMTANNETGVIQPIAELATIAREHKIPFHTDAIQAFGRIPLSVKQLGVDLLSLSAHKVAGPPGVGALYIRRGIRPRPLVYGGHHERSLRPGTENLAGIVGFATAAQLAVAELATTSARIETLRDRLQAEIRERVGRVSLNGEGAPRLPNTLNLSFDFIEGEGILLGLEAAGIAASSGSACTSGQLAPSHVLQAMGVDPISAQGSLRFSLGRDNTLEEILKTVEVLVPVVERLRAISPFSTPQKLA